MTHTGWMRLHFNRHGAAPFVWSVVPLRDGSTEAICEFAVRDVVVEGCRLKTVYRPKETPDDEDGKPSAWLEVNGVLTVSDQGVATVRP